MFEAQQFEASQFEAPQFEAPQFEVPRFGSRLLESQGRARRAASLVLVGLTCLWLGSCSPKGSDRDSLRGRDLILITVDTVRADAVGAYNPEAGPTPTIDALAERGLLFHQAMAPMPRTTPSLATLLSGRSPKHHGSREVAVAMSPHVPLISQVLGRDDAFPATPRAESEGEPARALGPYLSVGISGSRVAAPGQGMDRGFDVFRVVPGRQPDGEVVTRVALEQLEKALGSKRAPSDAAKRPLFLWVHYMDPHFPYGPLEVEVLDTELPETKLLEEGPESSQEDACDQAIRTAAVSAAMVYLDHEGVSSRALDSCRKRYYGEVARADRAIGQLFEGLRELGRDPAESLVIFTSDHGEHMGETGFFFEHGPTVHDAALRVPLIVAGPGIAPGRSDQVVELQDVVPTALTLLGVRPDAMPPLDGRSLADRWLGWERNDSESGRVAFVESNSNLRPEVWNTVVSGREARHCVHEDRWSLCGFGSDAETFDLYDHVADPRYQEALTEQHPEIVDRLWAQRQTWPPETARQRAVRDRRFKLVETPLPEGGYERSLYDLQADPAESRDVSADHPAVAESLGRRLDEFVADLPLPGQAVREDDDMEALRALGYVE